MRELDICINQYFGQLSEYELENFNAAAANRKAELTMGKLYDSILVSLQTYDTGAARVKQRETDDEALPAALPL